MLDNTYTLLDSGNFLKLEQVGPYRIVRPCPQAVWKPLLPKSEWRRYDDKYIRKSSGSGHWEKNALPAEWTIEYSGLKLHLKPTNFGHIGFFAEHTGNWDWLREKCGERKGLKTLNMFAYTGGMSLAMAQAGAQTTHLDAAKGIIDWAKVNAGYNDLNIRWICDDVIKFLQREVRRGNKYDGIVLDPPSYGRGPNREIWKIEEQINELLQLVKEVLSDNPSFVLFSCHTPHFTPKVLENFFHTYWPQGIEVESFEMTVQEHDSPRVVPSGVGARVTFK